MVVVTTAGPGVASTRPAALFPGDRVLKIAASRGPPAGWVGAFPVTDLDEVAEPVTRVVGGGMVPMVAVSDRDRV